MEYGPIIDWWILPHVGLFIWLASSVHSKWEPRWWVHLLLWLGLSYTWEAIEYPLQRAYPETWVVVEHWANAWIVDPLSNGIGWLVGALVGWWSKSRKRTST